MKGWEISGLVKRKTPLSVGSFVTGVVRRQLPDGHTGVCYYRCRGAGVPTSYWPLGPYCYGKIPKPILAKVEAACRAWQLEGRPKTQASFFGASDSWKVITAKPGFAFGQVHNPKASQYWSRTYFYFECAETGRTDHFETRMGKRRAVPKGAREAVRAYCRTLPGGEDRAQVSFFGAKRRRSHR